MGGDEPVTGLQIRSLQDGADLVQGHAQIPETADHLCRRDLIDGIPPVPGVWVGVCRFQEPDAVIVAQRLDAQVGGPGEVTDGQGSGHPSSIGPPPRGESRPGTAIDPPAGAAATVVIAGRTGQPEPRRTQP